jgi:hypothetical protein
MLLQSQSVERVSGSSMMAWYDVGKENKGTKGGTTTEQLEKCDESDLILIGSKSKSKVRVDKGWVISVGSSDITRFESNESIHRDRE